MSTQGIWDGVRPINAEAPCHICGSTENVERKQVPVTYSDRRAPGLFRQSNLCQECKDKGWTSPHTANTFSRLTYLNFKTRPCQIKNK